MKRQATVDVKRCAACGVCVKACPREALSVWRGCHAQVDVARCVGCGMCASACPVGCIELAKRGE